MKLEGKVLTFGEIMMRLSPPGHLRLEQANSFDVRYGGAEANVAFSLAYQKDDAAFVSIVPESRIGDCALRSLSAYGVDVSRVVRKGDRLGSYFFEIGASERSNGCVYDRKYSAMNLGSHTDFDWDEILDGVSVFYVSGVTPAVCPEMAEAAYEALAAARKHGIVTVADLNYRKLWTPDEAKKFWKRALPLVDICIANDEDAPSCLGISYGSGSLATGIEEKDAYVQIADELVRTYGVKMVASVIRDIRSVEDSDWMGMIYADRKAHFSSVHHMHVLEGVAGGDAFAAGLIHALLHGMDYDAAASYAIAASVLKLTIKGDSNFATAEDIAAVAAKGAGLRVSR